MKTSKGVTKKTKAMDYTNNAYNEAVTRLKIMLSDSYTPSNKASSSYLRNLNDDSSDNMSVHERPILSEISKYVTPSFKPGRSSFRNYKPFQSIHSSKENLTISSTHYSYQPMTTPTETAAVIDYPGPTTQPQPIVASVQAPVEIFNFIEKQEDYIDQLERESKFCRSELSNLLGKVKDVISENETLTEHARAEHKDTTKLNTSFSSSSESDDLITHQKTTAATTKKRDNSRSPLRFHGGSNIIFESRISELEAKLTQANIDLKRVKTENDDLKRKLALEQKCGGGDNETTAGHISSVQCEKHLEKIEHLEMDKIALNETIRRLQRTVDELKSTRNQISASSKRYLTDLVQMERSQSDLEINHLRDELDRQHERVRELQHEMGRRIAEERSNVERRYNNQVDQLGGDLTNQWEQVNKLQLELERQKRAETDLKRDFTQRNAQIEELKTELKANRSTFLSEMAQANAEKQSLEQEITVLRLQLDRSERHNKVESARLNAEINSLRQRLDRGDADLLHSKREVLRLNDEVANLEKELTYGEMKNEIRPTKKDLDKRISEMQEKHDSTVIELEEMIQSQKQLMDKLTNECKTLTKKLEDSTLKHNEDKQHMRKTNEMLMDRLKQIWANYKKLNYYRTVNISEVESCREEQETVEKKKIYRVEIASLQSNVEFLTNRMINNDRIGKIDCSPTSYHSLPTIKEASAYSTATDPNRMSPISDSSTKVFRKSSPYTFESAIDQPSVNTDPIVTTKPPAVISTQPAAYGSKSISDSNSGQVIDYQRSGYNYGREPDVDDENQKDNLGEGEKQQQQQQDSIGTTVTGANDYSDFNIKSTNASEGIISSPSDRSKKSTCDKNEYNVVIDDDANKTVLAEPKDTIEYAPDYSGYEGYDPQQYDASAYGDNAYDRQYDDGSQQGYNVTDQYDSNPTYDNTNHSQHGAYGGPGYDDQTYQQYEPQPAIVKPVDPEPSVTTRNTEQKPTIPPPDKTTKPEKLSTSFAPTGSGGSGITQITKKRPTANGSRSQSRSSSSTLGSANTRTKPTGGSGTGISNILPKQSSASAKGLSTGRRE